MGLADELQGLMWTEMLLGTLMAEKRRLSEMRGCLRTAGKEKCREDARLAEVERRLCEEIEVYAGLREDVLDMMSRLEDRRLRCVLEMRYANNMSWEEIAEEVGLSRRHVQRLHEQGLKEIEKTEAGML